MKKSFITKAAVLLIILVIVLGIYRFKNGGEISEGTVQPDSDFALHITNTIDMDRFKSHNLPIIIDFGSDSCVPCKEMAPVLEKLNRELQGRAIIKFVDVWKHRTLADGYPITLIPTQIFIDSSGKPYIPDGTESVSLVMHNSEDTGKHTFTYHEGQVTEEEMLDVLAKMGMK
ncbi:MAG: thioredoxin family protein [Deferribacterales bacterium]